MVALADVLRGWCSHWVRVGRWVPAYAGMTWWEGGMAWREGGMAWWDAGMAWWDAGMMWCGWFGARFSYGLNRHLTRVDFSCRLLRKRCGLGECALPQRRREE